MPLRAGIVVFVIVAMLLAVSPVIAAPPGGTGPGDAIPLDGTQSGTLPTGGQTWYMFFDNGTNDPLGVVQNFSPANIDNNLATSFEVWSYEKFGTDVVFTKIGMGTVSGQPVGVKFWRGASSKARTYYLRVFNNAPYAISYAMAFVGGTYPPPGLTIAPAGAPAPEPTPAPPAPSAPTTPTTPPPAPSPAAPSAPPAGPTTGGTSPDNAIPLTGQVVSGRVTDQSIWYAFFYNANNEAGIVMDFQPTNIETATNNPNANLVSFRVWTNICTTGQPSGSGCKLTQVGAGTRSGLPAGVKYWRTGGGSARTFFIEVFNGSGQPAGYAMTNLGTGFPPPGLSVPMP